MRGAWFSAGRCRSTLRLIRPSRLVADSGVVWPNGYLGDAQLNHQSMLGVRGLRAALIAFAGLSSPLWLGGVAIAMCSAGMPRVLSLSEVRRRGTRTESPATRRPGTHPARWQLDALVEHSPAGLILMSAEGRIDYASPTAVRLFGYAFDDFVGRDIFGLVHAQEVKRVGDLLDRVVAEPGRTASGEFRFCHADGSWRSLQTAFTNGLDTPGIHALIAHVWDIGQQDAAPPPFDVVADRFRVLIENAVHITAIVEGDGVMRYVSPAAERMLGYSAESLKGMHVSQLVHPQDADAIIGALAYGARHPGPGQLVQFRARHKDGSLRVLEAIATNRVDDPVIAGMVIDARDVTERKWSAERLQRSLEALLAIHDVGRLLGSGLEQQAIGAALLDGAHRVAPIDAAVLMLRMAQGGLRVSRTLGPRRLWETAHRSRSARAARAIVLRDGLAHVFRSPQVKPGPAVTDACALPLRVQERVVGILEVYGIGPADGWPIDELGILADQAASALERAGLYKALTERERRLERLVRQLLLTQEEERRRVAYEVHDGLAQLAAAAQQHLEAFASQYRTRSPIRAEDLRQALELASRTVREARRLIAGLRPAVLDDFGLAPAILFELQGLRDDGWQIEYIDKLGSVRLDPIIETALFRVLQEALANVRKHAQTKRVAVMLERLDQSVRLEIRDWGRGFRPAAVRGGAGPSERVGLAGMQERIALLSGRCTIRSRLGAGACISVEVPVREGHQKA